MDIQKLKPDAKAYFDGLPLHMQEMLMQTGAKLTTRSELMKFAKNMKVR